MSDSASLSLASSRASMAALAMSTKAARDASALGMSMAASAQAAGRGIRILHRGRRCNQPVA